MVHVVLNVSDRRSTAYLAIARQIRLAPSVILSSVFGAALNA